MNNDVEEIYIPASEEAKEIIDKELKKYKVFNSIDDFIHLYNERFINIKNDSVKELAQKIVELYINIFIQNEKFYVKSVDEALLDQTLFILDSWQIVLKLKRIAETLIDDDFPLDTRLYFLEGDQGYVSLKNDEIDPENRSIETDFSRYMEAERFSRKNDVVYKNVLLRNLLKEDYDYPHSFYITAEELIEMNSNFLKEVNELTKNAFSSQLEKTNTDSDFSTSAY